VFSGQRSDGDRQVFRSTGAVALWWVWLVFAVASLVALAVNGRNHSSVVAAVVVVAATGVVYGCALWPRIVADENGISVLNPLRGHTVPWPAVTKVDLVNAVRVHVAPAPGTARGKVIYSWAVQSSARAGLKKESRARRRTARTPAAYGQLPAQAQAVLERSPAEFIAQQLQERVVRERGPAAGGEPESAAQSPADAVRAPAVAVRVSWAWLPIAAMVIPALALIIAILA
jgi:PH (Pleckstrin Homology) domain-containing protein